MDNVEAINLVASLIGSIGFPIVACVGIFYLYDKSLKTFTEALTELKTTLDEIKERLRTDDDN